VILLVGTIQDGLVMKSTSSKGKRGQELARPEIVCHSDPIILCSEIQICSVNEKLLLFIRADPPRNGNLKSYVYIMNSYVSTSARQCQYNKRDKVKRVK
jgi:hypothetical protein